MTMLYLIGQVTTATFSDFCKDNGYDPKKCVFIFPGNKSHHSNKTTLFSIKSGEGLAKAAAELGQAGYPTLSLPTTTMEQWSHNQNQQQTVENAIQDLYKAAGAGFHLVLPVRAHRNQAYFDLGLLPDQKNEPSFWGGIQKASNKELANHYSTELDHFYEFLSLSPANRQQHAVSQPNDPFYQAYLQGLAMSDDDPWLLSQV